MPDELGARRERIVIKYVTPTRDPEGEMVVDWNEAATLATTWARCKFLPGRKFEDANKINAEASVTMTMNYRTDVTEAMRVLWRSKQWSIISIEPDENKMAMDLMVARVQ